MSTDKGMTVRELAEELDVTKQAIHKRVNQLPPTLTPEKVGGAYILSSEIIEHIKAEMNIDQVEESVGDNMSDNHVDSSVDVVDNQSDNSTTNQTPHVDDYRQLVDELKAEKERLYKQIDKKDDQLSEMQKLLDQQQQLTLYTNEQNQQLKLELKAAEEEREKEEELEEEPEEEKKEKKWWHLFG